MFAYLITALIAAVLGFAAGMTTLAEVAPLVPPLRDHPDLPDLPARADPTQRAAAVSYFQDSRPSYEPERRLTEDQDPDAGAAGR